MFIYYLELATRSLRRQKALAALIVLAIAVGIGASMTMLTVLHVMSSDPLPSRSAQLYHPWLYTQSENHPHASAGDQLTYVDAVNLLNDHRAKRQAMMASGAGFVQKQDAGAMPTVAYGQYVSADFFAMFGVPMQYGHAWQAVDGRSRAQVVVLGDGLNKQLFGGTDSVGKTLLFSGHLFRVIGVARPWLLQPKPYVGAGSNPFGKQDQFFLPLRTAVDLKLGLDGHMHCWGDSTGNPLASAQCQWLDYWVQLPDAQAADAYRHYLVNYAQQQKASGRFDSAGSKTQMFRMMPWLAHLHLVPPNLRLQIWLAQGFLLVCMLNVIGLLLAKFLRASTEAGIRRAMGATRRDIFAQFTMEGVLMGLLGGFLGVILALGGLWVIRTQPGDFTHLAHMDLTMLVAACVLALFATFLAALLPAWRVCRTAPAIAVKTS